MNYATLSQAIMDWLGKDNIGAVIPTIISFAQTELEDKLRLRAMEYRPANAVIPAGTGSLALPSDYLELMYLTLIDGTNRYPVELRMDIKEVYILSPDTGDTGLPKIMYRLEDNLYFNVATDIDYTREWAYYRRLAPLSDTPPNNTNWWSEKASEALLMTCLDKSSKWVSGISREDKIKWREAAKDAREALGLNEAREKSSGAILRTENWTL